MKKTGQVTVEVGFPHPFGNRVGVMLVRATPLPWKTTAPKRRINFRHGRAPGWDVPPVKGPEMDLSSQPPAQVEKPWQAGMGGFCHGTLDIELENRLGGSGPKFGYPPPPGIAGTRLPVARYSVTHEFHIGIVLVGGPMVLKIFQESLPVGRKAMNRKIRPGKGKAVVYPNQCRLGFVQPLSQPFGHAAPRPIFAGAG